jgi:hypothetical protein
MQTGESENAQPFNLNMSHDTPGVPILEGRQREALGPGLEVRTRALHARPRKKESTAPATTATTTTTTFTTTTNKTATTPPQRLQKKAPMPAGMGGLGRPKNDTWPSASPSGECEREVA